MSEDKLHIKERSSAALRALQPLSLERCTKPLRGSLPTVKPCQ